MQKYKVFVNHLCLVFAKPEDIDITDGLPLYENTPADIKRYLSYWITSNGKKNITLNLFCKDPQYEYSELLASCRRIQAAGGMVSHPSGDLLVIFRNNLWDLPKGKKDPGETDEQCAVREVEEETGVKGIISANSSFITHHLYQISDEWVLKETHWYKMASVEPSSCVSDGQTPGSWQNMCSQTHSP